MNNCCLAHLRLLIIASTSDVLFNRITPMTLNDLQPQNRVFSDFCDFWLQKSEVQQNGWTLDIITRKPKLPQALARLMSISSD